jgi:hypothetical protein
MERISIFNYEAFYLDFLEGNLSKEDTALLREFLEANPDLKMEDESLFELEAQEIVLDSSSKEQLKQPSMQDEITTENVSFFMISDAEGLLDGLKSKELELFIGHDKTLTREKELYAKVYFKPDESVVFGDKDSLKRKSTIVLWPYITAAAAACVIAFFLVWSSQNNVGIRNNNETPVIAEDTKKVQEEQRQNSFPSDEIGHKEVNNNSPEKPKNEGSKPVEKTQQNSKEEQIEVPPIREMEKLRPKNLITSLDEKQIEPIAKRVYLNPAPAESQQDYAMLHFSEMDNPIEPITKMISKQTNSEVDFRRSKKSKNEPHGFFLKIGKFELSRKKH